jgi:8-oxo-dGTP pyrophosphatase MutT (NUDIX family)
MESRAAGARAELAAAVRAGFRIPYTAQGGLSDRPLRRSAVLILFGALDDVPAAGPSGHVPRELDVLLTRRSDTMRHHPGQIAFPGGGFEAGDADLAATALREAGEETGLDPAGVDVLGELPPIHIPVSNNLVTPVVGWWRLPSEVAADHAESVEVFRVPVAELLDPAARGTSVLQRGPHAFRGEAFELGPRFGRHIVWGFTGILLSSVFDGVGWARPWDASRTFPIDL